MCHESDLFDVIKRANEAYVRDMEMQEDTVDSGSEPLDEYMESE
jgi:hypothetical protein